MDEQTRQFPRVGERRDAALPCSAAARAILQLAVAHQASPASTPRERLGRALHSQELALAAESGGRFRRADFYFEQGRSELNRLDGERTAWRELATWMAQLPDAGPLADAAQLRVSVLRELFAETRAALFVYRAKKGWATGTDRGFEHIRAAAQWMDAAGPLTAAETFEWIAPVIEAWTGHLSNKSCEIKAVQFFLGRLPRELPAQYVARWAKLRVALCVAALHPSPNAQQIRTDIATLDEAIGALDDARARHPDELSCYEQLGLLYHLRSGRRGGQGELDVALVDAQRAVLLLPGFEGAEKNWEQLRAGIEALQTRYSQLREQLAKTGAQLNAEGHRLARQALSGFRPLLEFRESSHFTTLSEGLSRAHVREAWTAARLPSDAALQERCAETWLRAALWIIGQKPQAAAEVAQRWSDALSGTGGADPAWSSALAELPADLALQYLERRLLPDHAESQPPAAPELPQLPSSERRARSDQPPLSEWFLSRQGMRIKLQLAAAVACAAYLTYSHVAEANDQARQHALLETMKTAAARGDDNTVIEEAEALLSESSLHRSKRRAAEAWGLYDAALVHWFSSLSAAPTEADKARITRYKELLATRDGADARKGK